MSAIRHDQLLMRMLKDLNDVRSALRRLTGNVNLPLYDINNENTPDQITADQDDYVIGNYDVLRLSTDAAGRTLTGLKGGVKGRFLKLLNIGSYEFIIAHQDAGSSPENRIISPTETDLVINTGGEISFYYDSTLSRWISSYNSNADRIEVDLRLSAAQNISNAVYEKISWTSVIKDTGNFFDAGTPTQIIIPSTGWYQVMSHVAWDVNGVNLRESLIEGQPMGNIAFDSRLAVTGSSTNVELSRLSYFNIGDTIFVYVWQNSGAGLNINISGPRNSATEFVVSKM